MVGKPEAIHMSEKSPTHQSACPTLNQHSGSHAGLLPIYVGLRKH